MTPAMHGLKVLDLSTGVAGPHVGMLCAQHGADVVKVEAPEGDWARELGSRCGDLTAYSVVYNQGNRSVAVDLKRAEGADLIRRLAAQADVFILSFRPGVLAKFGLDYESVRKTNEGVIYLSVTGFGARGPLASAPATDGVIQGFSGFMYNNCGEDGVPQRTDFILMDVITGLYGFQSVATSVLARERSSAGGCHLDCSLMQSALALQAGKIVETRFEGGGRALYVPLGVFRTGDGFVSISVRRDDHFAALCDVLRRPDVVVCSRQPRRRSPSGTSTVRSPSRSSASCRSSMRLADPVFLFAVTCPARSPVLMTARSRRPVLPAWQRASSSSDAMRSRWATLLVWVCLRACPGC
jgi:crotonobetainyl-CoA:carnitine CoA-transferase CaiB-like acyl-CoA transferase